MYANSNLQAILRRYIRVKISKINPHTRIVSKILLNMLYTPCPVGEEHHENKKNLWGSLSFYFFLEATSQPTATPIRRATTPMPPALATSKAGTVCVVIMVVATV